MQSVERQLEAREKALRKIIERNFSKTREVERELLLLRRDMDLTSGSRKLALEHMRCKIEAASERVSLARSRKVAAEAALQIASDSLSSEENQKTGLQEDMSTLICQNSQAQHARLAELTDRLEALTMQAGAPGGDDASGDASAAAGLVAPAPAPGMPSAHPVPARLAPAVTAVGPAEATPVEDESAVAAAAREDESAVAAAARGRHVGKPARGVPARPTINAQPRINKVPTSGTSAGFQGFNV